VIRKVRDTGSRMMRKARRWFVGAALARRVARIDGCHLQQACLCDSLKALENVSGDADEKSSASSGGFFHTKFRPIH